MATWAILPCMPPMVSAGLPAPLAPQASGCLTPSTMASRTDVETVRAFNRFYTRRMGLTRSGYAKQSLAEARVLYELGANDVRETGELRERLGIDAGQLSRL